ncbi:hypothetical protein ACVWZK_009118 [Bradyrhizobium sp. GM0.4]
MQQYDSAEDCLRIVASYGLTDQALTLFRIVRRGTNSTCAAALRQRMRVVVGNIAASYLFVGTRELTALQEAGVAAAHSTPIIVDNGQLWGVLTVHFRRAWEDAQYDPTPMERIAARFAERASRLAFRSRPSHTAMPKDQTVSRFNEDKPPLCALPRPPFPSPARCFASVGMFVPFLFGK